MTSDNVYQLPDDLPAPLDDGAARHLPGTALPDLDLPSTNRSVVSLAQLKARTVVYCYPMTGRPGEELPAGWDGIPGARGCTPQACAFRDHYNELQKAGANVYGLSTQSIEDQHEALERLHLPFSLLSDANHRLCTALRLPTFQVEGITLLKRLTMIVECGKINHVFYPVFPPDRHADEVLDWLAQ